MNHILIIDDDLKFGEFVGEVASAEGFDVTLSTEVDVFFSKFEEVRPTAILVDLMMPGVDGIEILRALSDRGCKANVLIASGVDGRTLNTAQQIGRNLGLKVNGTIAKPIRVAELRAILDQVKVSGLAITPDSLAQAIENGELFLDYQPKLDLISGKIAGVEALVRWRRPDGSVVYPDSFVPAVEKWNLADKMTRFVITNAVEQMSDWHSEGQDVQVAVNLSALNLSDLQLPNRIADECLNAGVHPSQMTLELTETATMEDANRMMEIATRLRLKDFKLSIDDFGTGYSSMMQLQRLPFSELKIDRSFVSGLGDSPDAQIIVNAMINLARNLGLSIVAEGVEDRSVIKYLCQANCPLAQGYHIAKPLPGAECLDLLRRWTPEIIC